MAPPKVSIEELARTTIAFDLLREAFLDLAEAHLGMDRERGHTLLHELQDRVVVRAKRFAMDHPDVAHHRLIGEGAMRVLAVLRQAQGLED